MENDGRECNPTSVLKPSFKLWLETENGYVLGKGAFTLLKEIESLGSIRGAADSLDMSYRYAWGMIRKIEVNMGRALVMTQKGGKAGGGGAKLTDLACEITSAYRHLELSAQEFIDREWRATTKNFSSQT